MKSLKIAVCIAWTILITSFVLFQDMRKIGGQAVQTKPAVIDDLLPDGASLLMSAMRAAQMRSGSVGPGCENLSRPLVRA